MKAALVVALCGAFSFAGVVVGLHLQRRPAAQENPFIKVGQLVTNNGVSAEVFDFRGECYVIVQMVLSEPGRAAVQMVCK